ncbi:hypothetical protein AVEN_64135-1 [Araneus ventricosus]|uniref:Uncharacterized protein n=1 Tax=Araneus ventricosus TaxID=182803 RepID=A0A4Y2C4Z1_ARAVE|nr:hypothetical protein AVEN_64135-1 [Araneus ventricosus]
MFGPIIVPRLTPDIVIHGPLYGNHQPVNGHSDPLLHLLSPSLSKRGPSSAPISSSATEPPPYVSTQVAFQHLSPASPSGFQAKLDFQNFDHTTPILIRYSHDDRFWCGTTEFACYGVIGYVLLKLDQRSLPLPVGCKNKIKNIKYSLAFEIFKIKVKSESL